LRRASLDAAGGGSGRLRAAVDEGTGMGHTRGLAVLLLVAVLLAAVACAADETTSSTAGGTSTTLSQTLGEDLMWNDGPCDPSKPELKLGLIGTFESGIISLKDQATAAEVSAEAFNARGGANGHCISMSTCDDGANPNQAQDCARRLVDEGVVLTVNDAITNGIDGVLPIFEEAGLARIDGQPAPQALADPLNYSIGAGGFGSTVMMVPSLTQQGIKKIAIIRVDSPGASALGNFMKPMADAYGAEFVTDLPVPAGTTDYTQFVLSAQAAGADGAILALGLEEATQVLRAAEQLGSPLKFSTGLGSLSQSAVAELGDFAQNVTFNAEVPPPSIDTTDYPLMAVGLRELAASGEENLQVQNMKTGAFKSWLTMYGLVSILRDENVTEFTRASMIEALNGATDVDMGGIIAPWTPNEESTGTFKRISSPLYYLATWDPATQNFVLADEQLDVVEQLAGNIG
jgi:ABC-type branched-subunit amino acid transport system substrate-binding protein